MSGKTLTIGGLHPSTFLVENLRLPVEETAAISMVQDAVDQAASERKAVAVVSDKGVGKTISLVQAEAEFREGEMAKSEADAGYKTRRFVTLQSPRSTKEEEVYSVIWKAVVGTRAPVRRRNRKVGPDELREKLVEYIHSGNVALLALDEAEKLSDVGLTVLRDIMSAAESTSVRRFGEGGYAAAGIGMVMLGASELEPRLRDWDELGHRLLRIVRLEHLENEEVAGLYTRFLPGIARHVEEVGESFWRDWVRQEVTRGKSFPIRAVENHVRNYVRRMAENEPEVELVDDIPFDEDVFLFTLDELPLVQRQRGQRTG